MEATSAGLTTGTLGAFTVVHGAAADIALTGSTANLTSGATRVLTATIQDAAGNTVTSDNTTVVAFAKRPGPARSPAPATRPPPRRRHQDDHRRARRLGHDGGHLAAGLTTGTLGAFTVVHGAADPDRAHRLDDEPHLRRDPRADGDDPGRRRQHRHRRQHHRRRLRQGVRTGTVSGTGNATASAGVASKTITGALAGSVTMEATSAGLTTGTLGAFTVVHGAAADIVLTGATTNLTSGATRVLTATIQDAAGNTVTSDNTTVVAFAKASGAGTVTGTGNATAAPASPPRRSPASSSAR